MVTKLLNYVLAFISLIILAAPAGKSSELNKHKMLKKLVKIYNKKLSDNEANKIASAAIRANSKVDCKVSWDLIVSIAITESALNSHAYNENTKDYGIMQINEKMIKRLSLNKNKLMKDINYSIETACRIITENKNKYQTKRPYWIGIYNAGTAFHKPVVVLNAKKYDKKIRTLMKELHNKSAKLYALEN